MALTLATPAGAGTIVILPTPGSMSQPRIFSDGRSDDRIYVCTAPGDSARGRCSVQRGSGPRRH